MIIQYKHAPSEARVERLLAVGARHHTHLHAINSEAVSLSRSILESIADDPEIEYISPDRPVSATLSNVVPAVNADIAARIYPYDGTGIGIAVIDSGIVNLHDFSLKTGGGSRIVYNQNFITSGSAQDQYGHGTHVSGILAGNGTQSTGSQISVTYRRHCTQRQSDQSARPRSIRERDR